MNLRHFLLIFIFVTLVIFLHFPWSSIISKIQDDNCFGFQHFGILSSFKNDASTLRNSTGSNVSESISPPRKMSPRFSPWKCVIGPYENDFEEILFYITSLKPFALVRYGDGERMLARGEAIPTSSQAFSVDKFWFEGGESELGKDLLMSLKGQYDQPYFYAFVTPVRTFELEWFLNNTEQHCAYITYANIFVNSNYPKTKQFLSSLISTQLHRIVLVANFRSVDRFLEMGNRVPFLKLLDDVPHTYKGQNRLNVIQNATDLAKAHNGKLFLVSGGPLAKVLVSIMWGANPQNQYVDFGSSMDEIFKGSISRPYMTGSSEKDRTWLIKRNGQVTFAD
jgi:hypothetical protein